MYRPIIPRANVSRSFLGKETLLSLNPKFRKFLIFFLEMSTWSCLVNFSISLNSLLYRVRNQNLTYLHPLSVHICRTESKIFHAKKSTFYIFNALQGAEAKFEYFEFSRYFLKWFVISRLFISFRFNVRPTLG